MTARLPQVARPGPALLIEAAAAILIASIAIRTRPFDDVATSATRRRQESPPDPHCLARLSRAITAVARRVPWRAKCMEEGIAAARMLSRRGYPASLQYGAAMIAGELQAHVWLTSGEYGITGCDNASEFVLLSQFPNDLSSLPVHH